VSGEAIQVKIIISIALGLIFLAYISFSYFQTFRSSKSGQEYRLLTNRGHAQEAGEFRLWGNSPRTPRFEVMGSWGWLSTFDFGYDDIITGQIAGFFPPYIDKKIVLDLGGRGNLSHSVYLIDVVDEEKAIEVHVKVVEHPGVTLWSSSRPIIRLSVPSKKKPVCIRLWFDKQQPIGQRESEFQWLDGGRCSQKYDVKYGDF